MSTLTIQLDSSLDIALTRLAAEAQRSKGDWVCDMLRKEAARAELRHSRELLKPYAERAGWLSDEDVFRQVP